MQKTVPEVIKGGIFYILHFDRQAKGGQPLPPGYVTEIDQVCVSVGWDHSCRFLGGREALPSRVWSWRGEYVWPLGFLASNTHLATKNPKFRTEIERECSEDLFFIWSSPEFRVKIPEWNKSSLRRKPFFWSSPEFGGEIPHWNRIIKLTKLCPLGICLINKKSTPMVEMYYYNCVKPT